MFAIIKTGGQQFKVAPGDTLTVDRLHAEAGSTFHFEEVLMLSHGNGDNAKVHLGRPTLPNVKVHAEIVRHLRGEKIQVFKYKRRKNYRKRMGFRAELTEVRIVGVHGPIISALEAQS